MISFFGAGVANSYNHVFRRQLLPDKFDDWVGHFEHSFGPRERKFGGVLKFRVHRRISVRGNQSTLNNITIEFMFVGINMFWARLRLILARAARRGLK